MYMSDEDLRILRKSIKFVKSLRDKQEKQKNNTKQNKNSSIKKAA